MVIAALDHLKSQLERAPPQGLMSLPHRVLALAALALEDRPYTFEESVPMNRRSLLGGAALAATTGLAIRQSKASHVPCRRPRSLPCRDSPL